jgi:hypothetical protein
VSLLRASANGASLSKFQAIDATPAAMTSPLAVMSSLIAFGDLLLGTRCG